MQLARVLEVIEATTAGVKNHVLSLARTIDRAKFKVTVSCPRVRSCAYGDTSFVRDLVEHGIPVEIVEMCREIAPFSDLKALLKLYLLIRNQQYDIVHAHSSKAGILGRAAAWLAGTPVIIYTPHAFVFSGDSSPLTRWSYVQLERRAALWADAIICVSESEREAALANGVAEPEKLIVIQNGIDCRAFDTNFDHEAKRQALGLNASGPVVGTVGRLSAQKAYHYLIEAAVEVLEACPETQFVIVGDGELRGELERLADEWHVLESCVFTGFRNDVPEIMRVFDIFVLPSLYEGLPYTILEAMAAARPVIATEVTGSRDIIHTGETGLLVPSKDPSALATAILHLLQDRTKGRRMGLAGRQVVESRFTLAQMVRRTEELYTTLLETKLASSFVVNRGIA